MTHPSQLPIPAPGSLALRWFVDTDGHLTCQWVCEPDAKANVAAATPVAASEVPSAA